MLFGINISVLQCIGANSFANFPGFWALSDDSPDQAQTEPWNVRSATA